MNRNLWLLALCQGLFLTNNVAFIAINGLVILSERPLAWNPEHTNPPGGLTNYYRANVIGGPGAFVLEAKDFNSFGQAIINKLIAEIAQAPPAGPTAMALK